MSFKEGDYIGVHTDHYGVILKRREGAVLFLFLNSEGPYAGNLCWFPLIDGNWRKWKNIDTVSVPFKYLEGLKSVFDYDDKDIARYKV